MHNPNDGSTRLRAADELLKKISDQEQHILSLQKQQRDVRFLAKQLFLEIQIRLNKRAKNNTSTANSLVYVQDAAIKEKIEQSAVSRQELITFIHERDQQNIVREKPSAKRFFKSFFWKLAAKIFNLSLKLAKKITRKLQ